MVVEIVVYVLKFQSSKVRISIDVMVSLCLVYRVGPDHGSMCRLHNECPFLV